MKVLKKVVLLLSCIAFFIQIAPANYFALALFGVLGILVGVQLGKWENSRLKPVWLIVLVLISVYIAYSTGRVFHILWEASSQLKALLSRYTADTGSLLNIFCGLGSVAAFPAVFTLVSMLFDWLRKIAPIVRDEYSIKPLFSSLSAFAKSAVLIIVNLLAAVVLGVFLLKSAFELQPDNIDMNVRNSVPIFIQEGSLPSLFSWCTSRLDNFTDALMLAEASDNSEGSALERGLMSYTGRVEGKKTIESFISHYTSGEEYTTEVSYPRYWHGYQIILKPLLEIMDYGGIRILNGIVQVSLVILVCVLLAKRKASQFILPYLCAYLMLNPIVLGVSLQYSACFYVFSLGCIVLLLLPTGKRNKYAFLVFLNIGIFNAYFDYLTYPMATFGIPAVLYTALQGGETLEKKLNNMIRCGVSWCIGYGGMWVSKWVVTYLLTGYNAIENGLSAVLNRTTNTYYDGTVNTKATCILLNYGTFLFTPAVIICIAFAVYLIKNTKPAKLTEINDSHSVFIPYALLACAPAVWFAFASNHLFPYFTSKAICVTVLAILCGLADLQKRRTQ